MSLAPLPPSPRKVRLWYIIFALPAMDGPLPAELKFGENAGNTSAVADLAIRMYKYTKIQGP